MKSKLKKLPPLLFCLLLACFLMAAPQKAAECISKSLKTCLFTLTPSLFPFFVLSSILSGSGITDSITRLVQKPFHALFGVSGKGALPFTLGLLGGYPTGVKTVCAQYENGDFSEKEANRLLLFCGNTGPAFIIGAAGLGIFASPKAGLLLYACHVLSALILGLACKALFGSTDSAPPPSADKHDTAFAKVFTASVTEAAYTCINVSAFVMLFSLIAAFMSHTGATAAICSLFSHSGADPLKTKAVITGFLEIASGIEELKAFGRDIRFALPAAAFILSFGGVSVHAQALSFISPCGLRAGGYILAKFCHGILAALLVFLLTRGSLSLPVFAFTGHALFRDFLFDYLGLFFSIACAAAALVLGIIRRSRNRS